MATENLNKSKRVQRNQNIAKGLRTACGKNSIPVNGKIVKAGALAAFFDESTEAEAEVTQSRARYLAAVEHQRETEAKVKPLIQPIKAFVQNMFGEQSEVSASFGFSPRKTAHVKVETRAQAVLKLRATREAHGTMGSRQKAAIHGDIETPAPSEPVVTTPGPAPVATNGVNGSNGASN